jgi:hypothetical protein
MGGGLATEGTWEGWVHVCGGECDGATWDVPSLADGW